MTAPDFPTGLSLAEARDRVVAAGRVRRLGVERVCVDDAHGRVLAQDVVAPFDLPPFANSAMDGFALRAADLADGETRLRIVGTRFAGDGAPIVIAAGECVRITTGAPIPAGADAVAIKENVRVDGDVAMLSGSLAVGTHVRASGEDVHRGEQTARAGDVLSAGHLGMLASFGLADIEVVQLPRVVLLTTGDELSEPGAALAPGQIYNSNRHSLVALLRETGVASVRHEHVRDDPPALRSALLRAAEEGDLILTSGGVSAGEADFLPGLLQELGRVHFWKVRVRPGMPFLFGDIGKALVCSLPGNPVSSMATFLGLLRPGLDAMSGRRERPHYYAQLGCAVQKTHVRAEYQRATAVSREDGTLIVTPFDRQGSGMLHGMVRADCLVLIPESVQRLDAGAAVEILPLRSLS